MEIQFCFNYVVNFSTQYELALYIWTDKMIYMSNTDRIKNDKIAMNEL